MGRVDLFGVVHKGIRALLFELSSAAARLDVTSSKDVDGLAARIEHVLELLEEHARHEDAVIAPALPAEVAGMLAIDHGTLDELAAAVAEASDALALAGLRERAAAGGRLSRAIDRLVAAHLVHMIREETEANAALWAACDDDALIAMQARIHADIPPARMSEWLEIIAPALNPMERRLVVEGRLE
ncbi:MAG: hemerythrin domain-containing protein [Deltaproteobacteria bacterium]|nr:hemerythrin domain-containing protein [Deltaproteobacteria bacterium]MCW5808413.1 hemerythrin domain-containing protein [Deltaproteobacteria bacterium]